MSIKETKIRVSVQLDGIPFPWRRWSPSSPHPRRLAAQVRDLADQIAGFIESRRKALGHG